MTSTGPRTPNSLLSGRRAVSLVARREIRTRLGSKAFRITTVVMLVAVVALCLVFKAVSGGDDTKHVAFAPASAPLAPQLAALGKASGQQVTTSTAGDTAAAEKQVKSGKLDALVSPGAGGTIKVTVKKDLDPKLTAAFGLLARQQALDQQITGLGGSPAKVSAAVDGAKPQIHALEKKTHYNTERLVLGTVVAILIFMSLQMYGQMVAQGVVEEKTSRVVEILLASVRPWQLMAGKVLGIGAIGLLQLLVIGGGGLTAALTTGVLSLSAGAAVGILIWLVVWFLLGFFMYALLMAAAGAMVSRQEDVASVAAPITLLVIAPYIIGISVLPSDPGNTFVAVLSIIPLFAPTLMPVRLAMGHVPVWESGLAVILAVVLIPLLVRFAGRIYANAVLRTGSRVRFRDALGKL